MKNEHIKDLKKAVPKSIRLEVYKQAIEAIEKNQKVANMGSFGLCLLLPCLLWGLKTINSLTPNKTTWNHDDATIAFPELTNRVLFVIRQGYDDIGRKPIRLNYLKEFVNKLSNRTNLSDLKAGDTFKLATSDNTCIFIKQEIPEHQVRTMYFYECVNSGTKIETYNDYEVII